MGSAQSTPPRATSRLAAFRFAFEGWWHVLRTQPNARIHAAFSVAVAVLGFWLGIGRVEWAILILTIGAVWMAEFANTALEAVVDLASPEIHPLAKIGKDVAAATVLVGAGTSAIVGLLILGPPLWNKLKALGF